MTLSLLFTYNALQFSGRPTFGIKIGLILDPFDKRSWCIPNIFSSSIVDKIIVDFFQKKVNFLFIGLMK